MLIPCSDIYPVISLFFRKRWYCVRNEGASPQLPQWCTCSWVWIPTVMFVGKSLQRLVYPLGGVRVASSLLLSMGMLLTPPFNWGVFSIVQCSYTIVSLLVVLPRLFMERVCWFCVMWPDKGICSRTLWLVFFHVLNRCMCWRTATWETNNHHESVQFPLPYDGPLEIHTFTIHLAAWGLYILKYKH